MTDLTTRHNVRKIETYVPLTWYEKWLTGIVVVTVVPFIVIRRSIGRFIAYLKG